MERRHLEYLLAIAERGSFTAAAASLHVSQSALSQGIAQFEKLLGAPVFHRSAHNLRLTPVGEAVVGPAQQALRAFSLVTSAAANVSGLVSGSVDIAVLPVLAVWPVAPLVTSFRVRNPGVRTYIRGPLVPRTAELAEMIYRGVCEIGVTERGTATHGLAETNLCSHDYVALLPPGHTAARTGKITVGELLEGGLIAGTMWETSLPYRILRDVAPGVIDEAVVVRIDHREAYVPFVLEGAGAAVLPRYIAEPATMRGAVLAEIGEVNLRRDVVLVRRRDPLSPAAQAMFDFALSQLTPGH